MSNLPPTPPPEFDAKALGWRAFFKTQVTSSQEADGFHPARVCRVQAKRCQVWSDRPGKAAAAHALPIQVFGPEGLPAVGDWLLLDPQQKHPPHRLDRFSALTRQAPGSRLAVQTLAANVDTLFIVTACNQEFNVGRIERYLALAAEAGTRPVLVLTKADLNAAEPYRQQARALDKQLQIECLDARDPDQLEPLRKLCGPGQTVAALGSSGVGKSTLINSLTGQSPEGSGAVGQAVGEVRGDDNKGKHTTTARSLHRLPAGGVLVDLPGIRELQLTEAAAGLDDTFAEITALIADCKFRNCHHAGEPGCAITRALAAGQLDPRRWESYRKLQGEQTVYVQAKDEQDKREDRKILSKKAIRRLERDERD